MENDVMVSLSEVLKWYDNTFDDGEWEDWYRKRIVPAVISSYNTKEELRKNLIYNLTKKNEE